MSPPTSVQATRKDDILYIYRGVDFGLVLSIRAKEVCINDMTFVLDETKALNWTLLEGPTNQNSRLLFELKSHLETTENKKTRGNRCHQ